MREEGAYVCGGRDSGSGSGVRARSQADCGARRGRTNAHASMCGRFPARCEVQGAWREVRRSSVLVARATRTLPWAKARAGGGRGRSQGPGDALAGAAASCRRRWRWRRPHRLGRARWRAWGGRGGQRVAQTTRATSTSTTTWSTREYQAYRGCGAMTRPSTAGHRGWHGLRRRRGRGLLSLAGKGGGRRDRARLVRRGGGHEGGRRGRENVRGLWPVALEVTADLLFEFLQRTGLGTSTSSAPCG